MASFCIAASLLLVNVQCSRGTFETVKELSEDEPVLQQAALSLPTINFCFDPVVVLGGREGLESLEDGLLVEVLGLRGLVSTFWNGTSPH